MGLFKRKASRTVLDEVKTAPPGQNCFDLQLGNVQGIGTRQTQEDSFAFSGASGASASTKDGVVAVLADGMGGMAHGRACSEAAVAGLCALYAELGGDAPMDTLKAGVDRLNQSIFERFDGKSGTTALAAYLNQDGIRWLSIGDSAIFLRRGDGVYQLNCAHSQRNALYIRALSEEPMNPLPAQQNPDAPRLRSFLGMRVRPEIDISIRPLPLKTGDAILLCSDGISGVLNTQELLRAMSLPPAEGCAQLETMILEKNSGSQDNYTGILIAYTGGAICDEEA